MGPEIFEKEKKNGRSRKRKEFLKWVRLETYICSLSAFIGKDMSGEQVVMARDWRFEVFN